MNINRASDIHAILDADSDLSGACPGGIYLRSSLPRKLFSREGTPACYGGSPELLLTTCVVHGRATAPFGGLRDSNTQVRSVRQVVEVWFYTDGDRAISVLETAAAYADLLLDQQTVSGVGRIEQFNRIEDIDPELNDARFLRLDYNVVGVDSTS